MLRSGADVARQLQQASRAVPDATRRGVLKAGGQVTKSVEKQLDRDVPGRKLRSGAKSGRSTGRSLSVRSSLLTRQNPNNPAMFISARGPWQVIERDTQSHLIMPKALRRDVGRALVGLGGAKHKRSGSKKSRVLAFEGGGFARFARHPGTKGKHTFRRGVKAEEKQAARTIGAEIRKGIAGVFR